MKRALGLALLGVAATLSVTMAGFQGRGRGPARPEGLLQQAQGAWQPGRVAAVEKLRDVGDLFAWQGVPRLMAEDGGSTIEFPETLRKAQAAIKNIDTIITGHTRIMRWQEWVEQREFVTEYVQAGPGRAQGRERPSTKR
jgi:hypothetical protein